MRQCVTEIAKAQSLRKHLVQIQTIRPVTKVIVGQAQLTLSDPLACQRPKAAPIP